MLLFGNRSIEDLIATLIALLIGMTIHEFAHVYVAFLAGDMTGAEQGRLTLNPMVHINWVGFAMFALIGFGILGSAPVDARRMRDPRWGYLAAVAAGPLSNLFLAIIVALPFKLGGMPEFFLASPGFLPSIKLVIDLLVLFSVLLFLFNILPFYPMDGWTIVRMLLPVPARYSWDKNRMITQYVLMGLIFVPFLIPGFPNILGLLITTPLRLITQFLIG